jgi:hypothetical protein
MLLISARSTNNPRVTEVTVMEWEKRLFSGQHHANSTRDRGGECFRRLEPARLFDETALCVCNGLTMASDRLNLP